MEEDIKLLEKVCQRPIEETEGTKILKQAIENLINKYKEQEKVIELMVTHILTKCSTDDCKEMKKERGDCYISCSKCIEDYFRKKAKGE